MKSYIARVPNEYGEEVEKMIKTIQAKFGIKIPKIRASKLILLKSRKTNYILTESELIKVLGR